MLKWRNMMAKVLQKEDDWENLLCSPSENLKWNLNDIKTLVLALSESFHGKIFSWMRHHGGVA
jgi:hypothetical protein